MKKLDWSTKGSIWNYRPDSVRFYKLNYIKRWKSERFSILKTPLSLRVVPVIFIVILIFYSIKLGLFCNKKNKSIKKKVKRECAYTFSWMRERERVLYFKDKHIIKLNVCIRFQLEESSSSIIFHICVEGVLKRESVVFCAGEYKN